jgi:hypothetical protein
LKSKVGGVSIAIIIHAESTKELKLNGRSFLAYNYLSLT